ncbi:uncharacterized protein [Typha latifolia]|uniref:uncharacterized protein n=1 Tax=Typha latifolia TaxID=4733 RepID=UPI003C2B2DD5
MMNVLALALLISSLAAAGVWSPSGNPTDGYHHHHSDQVLREGHRVIVVEYERQVPTDDHNHRHLIQETKDKFQEAASLLPNLGQGLSAPLSEPQQPVTHSTKDKICDAYGVCKDKLSTLIGRGKDKLSDTAETTKDKLSDATSKVSDTTTHVQESAKDKLSETVDRAKDKLSETLDRAKDKLSETVDRGKDKVSGSASHVEKKAKDSIESAADKASHIREEAKGGVKKTVDSVEEAADKAEAAARELRKNLTDIARRARDVAYDAAGYMAAPEAGLAAAAVAHLLGFATAYGTCVWVTFMSSHVLAAALPRQQLGIAQSKLYPVYFRAMAYGVGVALLAHFFGRDRRSAAERVQGYNLLAAFGMVIANLLFLEPKATKVMFERMKMEKEEGRGRDMADMVEPPVVTGVASTTTTTTTATPAGAFGVSRSTVTMDQEMTKSRLGKANKRLKRLNSVSSLLNVLTLMCLTWHLVHLARRLQANC